MFLCEVFARVTTPLLCKLNNIVSVALYFYHAVIKIYEETGRHTYVATAIPAFLSLLLLMTLFILYKILAPIPKFDNMLSENGQVSVGTEREDQVSQVV